MLVAVALVLSVVNSFRAVRCDAGLRELPEPAGWRAWPPLPNLAGYAVVDLDPSRHRNWADGWTSPRPKPLGKAMLAAGGMCPERGAPLERWFTLWDSYRRSDSELALRRAPAGDVWVIAGQLDRSSHPQGEELFVVAFQPFRDGWMLVAFRVIWPPLLAALILARVLAIRRQLTLDASA